MATQQQNLPTPAGVREAFASQVKSLVARIEAGDKEAEDRLVRLVSDVADEFGQDFVEEAVGDLLDKAAEAQAAQQDAEPAKEKAQQEAEQKGKEDGRKDPAVADKERRQKIAEYFSAKGLADAAVAIEMDLNGQDGQTLAWIARVLQKAIPAAGLYRWAKFHAYRHRNKAARLARQRAEETTRMLFARFLQELRTAEQAVATAREVPRGVWAKMAQYARGAFERAAGMRFHGWALAAIERMVNGQDNPIVELLCKDAELAATVAAAPERTRARVLLDTLKERVRLRLEALEQRIAQRREKSRMDSARREENRRARIGNGPQKGPSGQKPGPGRSQLGPRAAGDPNRGGKRRGKRK